MRKFIEERLVKPEVRKGGKMIYLNPFTYLYFRRRFELLTNTSIIRFDGILMSTLMKLFYSYPYGRNSFDFTSLADEYFHFWSINHSRIAIYGATDDDLRAFIDKLKEKYDLNIVDFYNGYQEIDWYERRVDDFPLDVVILGLGPIKQEIVCNNLSVKTVITCGAFITQTANAKGLVYYPEGVKKIGLLWLYRIFSEKGHYKRFLLHYPRFMYYYFKDFIYEKN